jgi:hypothetical protein
MRNLIILILIFSLKENLFTGNSFLRNQVKYKM